MSDVPDVSNVQNVKSVYQSKTLWLNLIMAGVAFFPEVQVVVSEHPEIMMAVFAAANFALRLFTKSKIELS